jgi:hypothetical protein
MENYSSHPLYGKQNIDSAMNLLWEFYKKNFLSLFLISLVMSLIIQYVSTFINVKELQSMTDPVLMLNKLKDYIVPIVIISILNLLFTTILQYHIIYKPLNSENNIFVSAKKSMKYLIPYLILMVLLAIAGTIAIILGIIALVIGVFFSVLYITTLYCFILPVLMVEDPGIGRTISRTITLAHRNFWANIGWVAVFIIIILVVSLMLSGIILIPFTGGFIKAILHPDDTSTLVDITTNPLFNILSAAVNALTIPLMPIFAAILYFNGKAGEEQGETYSSENSENGRVRVEDLYAKPYSDDHPDNPDNKG